MESLKRITFVRISFNFINFPLTFCFFSQLRLALKFIHCVFIQTKVKLCLMSGIQLVKKNSVVSVMVISMFNWLVIFSWFFRFLFTFKSASERTLPLLCLMSHRNRVINMSRVGMKTWNESVKVCRWFSVATKLTWKIESLFSLSNSILILVWFWFDVELEWNQSTWLIIKNVRWNILKFQPKQILTLRNLS